MLLLFSSDRVTELAKGSHCWIPDPYIAELELGPGLDDAVASAFLNNLD